MPGRFSRNDMNLNIKALLDTGVITLDDLSEFSDEVKDMAEFVALNNKYEGYVFYPLYVQDISKVKIKE